MIKQLVLATRNKNKVVEMQQLLHHLGVTVTSALDYPQLEDVEEDAPTLEGNAIKKCNYVAAALGLPSLSDDTGLEVEALGGAPGVYSARYSGPGATYQSNVQKLLSELDNTTNRNAQFRSVMALSIDGHIHTFEGIVRGEISTEEAGKGGFGYDPVFIPHGYTKTFAELPAELKNEISHRGRAIAQVIEFIAGLK
ncbi:MAG: RdgB/HAM1 family non-canonical purine NTP pyrophosphatase [Bacteroidota bacterium]